MLRSLSGNFFSDTRAVLTALKAKKHPAARGRSLYMFQQELLPLYTRGLVSFPNEQTLVLGWEVNNLADMPTRVRPGNEKLPAEITELLVPVLVQASLDVPFECLGEHLLQVRHPLIAQ